MSIFFLVLFIIPLIVVASENNVTAIDSNNTNITPTSEYNSHSNVATAVLTINDSNIQNTNINPFSRFFEKKESAITFVAIILTAIIGLVSVVFIIIRLVIEYLIKNSNKKKVKITEIKTEDSKKSNIQTQETEIKDAMNIEPSKEFSITKEDQIDINKILTPKQHLKKINNILTRAETSLEKNNIENAKRLYLEAKTIYFNSDLDYDNKSKVYNKIIKLNDKLNKKSE